MKASELREKSKIDLEKELNKLLEEQFFLRTKKSNWTIISNSFIEK